MRQVEKSEFRGLYRHMERDFPRAERPPYISVRKNLMCGVFDAMYMTVGGETVGYTIIVAPEGINYALVHFLAVLPECRGSGYGSAILKAVAEKYPERVLVLEVEAIEASKNDDERTQREARVRFYNRAGYRIIPTAHTKIFGVDMEIMANTKEDISSVRDVLHALYLPTFPSKIWLRNIDVEDI